MSDVSSSSSIIGSYERNLVAETESTVSGYDDLDGEAFLQLLVAQIENQDPLDPMDDTAFVSQLAEFSNLEELTSISEGVSTLVENTSQEMLSGVNYIGKAVVSAGNTVSKVDDSITPLYYEMDESASSVTVNIFDASGNIVDTEELGAQQAGTYSFTWDGTDYDAEDVADGSYTVRFAAEGADGESVLVSTEVAGLVRSVESLDGQTMLNLSDGRSVDILDVREVTLVDSTSSDSET